MNPEKAFELQNNIKMNNLEYQDFVSDIDRWIKRRSNKTDEKILDPVGPSTKKSKEDIKAKETRNITLFNKKETNSNFNASKSLEHKELGNSYYKNGEYDKSVDAYTCAISLDSSNKILFSNRAMSYIKLKQYDKAIDDCNSCLKIDNSYFKALYRRAFAYLKTSKYKLAINDIQLFLDYQPNNKEALSVLEQAEAFAEAYKLASTGSYEISTHEIEARVIVPKFGSFDRIEEMKEIVINDLKEVKVEVAQERKEIYGEEEVEKIISSLEAPKNYAEFEKTVNGFGDSLLLFYGYFKKISPNDYRKLFSEMLEANLLVKIINGVKKHERDYYKVVEVLEKMAEVKRFSFVILFLNEKDKESIKEIINECSKHVNVEKVENIRKQYLG